MKKHLILPLVLFTVVFSTSAQKEVYFADKAKDSVSISGLHGLQFSTTVYSPLIDMPIGIGYLQELKLGRETSLLLSGNIQGSRIVKSMIPTYDANGMNQDFIFQYAFDIIGNVQIEPRWYFYYQERYMKGKNTKHNSGWYVGLPVTFTTTPLFTAYRFEMDWEAALSLGYRYALSKNVFLEASASWGVSRLYDGFMIDAPKLNLKAAYTFK
jgi:hypothetical protein